MNTTIVRQLTASTVLLARRLPSSSALAGNAAHAQEHA